MHRSRGRESNRKCPEELKARVIELYRQNYEGFGPTLAQEKLCERDGIRISDETLRLWLIETGLRKKRRKGRQHRQWRPRKERYGEMIQMDGSHHDWFEGRGPVCVFMGYIDDATEGSTEDSTNMRGHYLPWTVSDGISGRMASR